MADRSIHAYTYDLNLFLDYCAGIDADPVVAQIDIIDSYFLDMQRRGMGGVKVINIETRSSISKSTIHRRAVSLKMWFRHLVSCGLRPSNPLEFGGNFGKYFHGRRRSKQYMRRPKTVIWIPSDSQWKTLWSYVLSYCDERDQFMLRLSYECGLRVSELVEAQVEDFDFVGMHFTVRNGKGGVSRTVPFTESFEDAFLCYMEYRREVRTGAGPMFVSRSARNYGNQIKSGTWQDRIDAIRSAVDLPLLHTHTMRHLVCTDLARQGMQIEALAKFAGHASLKTTQQYIDLSAEDVKRGLARSMKNLREWRVAQVFRPESA